MAARAAADRLRPNAEAYVQQAEPATRRRQPPFERYSSGDRDMAKTAKIRVGIGGWTYAPCRGGFYPDDPTRKRELEYSSRHLGTIEVNGIFTGRKSPRPFKAGLIKPPMISSLR